MINCPLCTKVFHCPSSLNCHMVSHTKEKPHKCHTCSAAFGTINDQKKHIKSVHDGIKQVKNKNSHCLLCSFKFSSKTLLKIHMRKHSAEQPFSCSVPSCEFKTKYENCLKRHVRVVHNKERSYECPSEGCSYRAKCAGNLRSHLKTHVNEKPFKCRSPGCNYACKFNYHLIAHTSRAHSAEKPFKCSSCDYRAKNKSSLIRHVHTHKKAKRFQCQVPSCGFASHQKDKLKLHFDRKHGIKNVVCTSPGCNFRCGTITVLKEHLKLHEKPMLKCPCNSCNFRTRYGRTLLSHISRRHEAFPPEKHQVEKPKHVCTLCLSRFSSWAGLKGHLKRHTGEKPYRCSHCRYKAASSSGLRQHVGRVHHIHVIPCGKEDEVRQCRTCNVNFWSYSELVFHSMSHLQPVVVLEQLKLQVL